MELFFKLFEELKREGPGSYESTQRAFQMCKELSPKPAILDLGCGTGAASIDLAHICDCTIVASDIYQPFLDTLITKATKAGVVDKIVTTKADMSELNFEPESFDIIWSEGAAYIMGVDKAMAYWKQFVKPGGYIAYSDLVWLTRTPDKEAMDFWAAEYPTMRTIDDNIKAGEALGYKSMGHFTIDEKCWEDYYGDLEKRLKTVEQQFNNEPDGPAIIESTQKEIALYKKHKGSYGYEFHVFRK